MARKVPDRIAGQLLALLRTALRLPDAPVPEIDPGAWPEILRLAREQSVIGLIDSAVRLSGGELAPPPALLMSLLAEGGQVAIRSRHIRETAAALLQDSQAAGLHPLLMKGPAVAAYYPDPDSRVSGDIDFFIPSGEMPRFLGFIARRGGQVEQTPDGSYFCRKFLLQADRSFPVDVDIHDAYYDLHCPAELLPEPGSPEGVLLMLSAHILKHAMGPGVGLRQFCDILMAYRALEGNYSAKTLLACFRKSGTWRWARVLDAFLRVRFGFDPGLFPGPLSGGILRDVRRLERRVFSGGNFGHYDRRRRIALQRSEGFRKRDTVRRFLCNLPFSLRCAPREFWRYLCVLIRGNMCEKPDFRRE